MRFNISVRSIWEKIHISKDSIIKVVRRMSKKHKSFKIYIGASFIFSREDNVIEEKYMRTNPPHLITSIDSFTKSPIFEELIRFESEEQQQGSGFNIGNVSNIDLNILKSTPLKSFHILTYLRI